MGEEAGGWEKRREGGRESGREGALHISNLPNMPGMLTFSYYLVQKYFRSMYAS